MGGKEITINYIESPKVSIGNDYKGNYYVEFIDSDNDQIIHSSNIKGGMWTSCKREWFTNWVIKVNGEIVDKQVGAVPKGTLSAKIDAIL